MNSDIKAILEGLLFIVGEEGVSLQQLASAVELNETYIESVLDEIQKEYLQDNRGFELVNYGGNYKLVSKALVHPYAQKLFSLNKPNTLSSSALETLAVIAYKQPITRVEIEEIRGVGCDVMLRKLQAKGLIREYGRSEVPGRPILYEVSKEFMDVFQLLSLNELPELPSYQQIEDDELYD